MRAVMSEGGGTEVMFTCVCLQVDKVLSVAEDVKNIGNNLFKKQDWNAAANKYSKALR